MAALLLAVDLFQMDHHVGGPFDQSLVVGDKQHDAGKLPDDPLQIFQRFDVDVVGRLVQQQSGRFREKQACQLGLYLFPAGQGSHDLVAVKETRRKPQGRSQFRQPAGRRIRKQSLFRKEFPDGEACVFFRQLLGQVGQAFCAGHADAFRFRIVFDQSRVEDPLEQCGFSVALLADDHGFVACVQGHGEILQDRPQVTDMVYGQMLHLKHIDITSHKKVCSAAGTDPKQTLLLISVNRRALSG